MLHFRKPKNPHHVEIPTRQKFIFGFFVLLSLFSLLFDRLQPQSSKVLRETVLDYAAPPLSYVSFPVSKVHYWFIQWKNVINSDHILTKLQLENQNLKKRLILLESLKDENAELKTLLSFTSQHEFNYVIGRMIADTASDYARSFLIQIDTQTIKNGQAVIAGDGLLGRIIHIGDGFARVLLINDLNSRIPVKISEIGYQGILAGNNSLRPELLYVAKNVKITPGMHVVTSGDGGIFPPGLDIGKIISITDDQIFVQPEFDQTQFGYVTVITSNK